MKRAAIYLSTLLLGIFFVFISGCSTTPEETCEQEDICTGKTVTACCNEDECFYEYNGVKYGDDKESLDKLAKDLGCTFAASASYDTDIKDLILRLESLREIARAIN